MPVLAEDQRQKALPRLDGDAPDLNPFDGLSFKTSAVEMLALAEQAGKIGAWAYDPATGKLVWSRETFRIYGYDPQGPTPDVGTVLAGYLGDDAHRARQRLDQSVLHGQGYEQQSEIRRPDGTVRHIASRGFHRLDETGAVIALYGTVQDVTDITLADAALRASEARLRSLNWALSAYARSASALLRSKTLDEVIDNVCEAVVAEDAYLLAAVVMAEPTPSKALRVVAGAGRAAGYLDGLNLSWDEALEEGRGPTGHAIRSGLPQVIADSATDNRYGPWREAGLRFGIRSKVAVPFFRDGSVLGVLVVYAAQADAFGDQELTLFQKLADELVFSILLEEDRARLAASQQAQIEAVAAEAEARQRLVESEARFRMLAEHVPDIIMRYDTKGVVEYISPSVRQLGYDPEALIGRPIREFTTPRAGTLKALKLGLPLPSGRSNEWQATCTDGRVIWLQGSPAPIFDDQGEPCGVITVMRDVTDRRVLEDELRRKQAEAEAASVVKAQFLANMSHEIRTPLTGVIGFASLLASIDGLPDRARTYANRISTGGQALLSIVNDVLDFSKLEAGRIELDPQPHDLTDLVDEALGLVHEAANRKELKLRQAWGATPPAQVLVDRGRLRQVLLNLLGNAIKFTEDGGVTLTVTHEAAAGGRLRFEVADTGMGVSPEHAERLFQRFSQIDGSNTRQFGGAGLGLAISKGLVEAMGGDIGLNSVEGQGSTFWFTVAAPATERVIAPVAGPDLDDGQPAAMSPLKILIVDDVVVNRELICAMLEPFEVETWQAANGVDAVEAAMVDRFDLILMDLQMPGMDGLAATKAIRANSDVNRATPILAVSANVMPPQIEACRQAGMNDHIGKPINPTELLSKIAAWADA